MRGFQIHQQNYDQMINRLQEIAQTWEHILFLSGGKLNLSKCSWYVLSWEWKSGRTCLRPILPSDPTISLHQGNHTEVSEIKRTDPAESTRMLGVYLNPMGDFSDHLEVLKQKANSYSSHRMY